MVIKEKNYVTTRNACKACTPLGAAIAFKGVEGCVPLMHGSQGCSTYMRRYMISHFREPVDIASSNFAESSAVFGGKLNLKTALDNVIRQYNPKAIGIATTCLAETIGDNVKMIIDEYKRENPGACLPKIFHVSTPSYTGTHIDGFHAAVKAVVSALAGNRKAGVNLNVFPGLFSPSDIRYLKEILSDFNIKAVLLPDYSQALDSTNWEDYTNMPSGGTTLNEIEAMGGAKASVDFTVTTDTSTSAAGYLQECFGIKKSSMKIPLGIELSDEFFKFLANFSENKIPQKHAAERGRLIDSYFDGHKYVFGKRAVIYGEEDLVVSLAVFLKEIGIDPVLCVSGGESGKLAKNIAAACGISADAVIKEGTDFMTAAEIARKLSPDIVLGSSKGYPMARQLNVPLVRIGFPIHDRFGGQRLLGIGYRGTQQLFDSIVNVFIEKKQNASAENLMYM